MTAARDPVQRRPGAKLLVIDRRGNIQHRERSELVTLLCPGDLVIANDAATIPASLSGTHVPSGRTIEVRLAGRNSLAPDDILHFSAVVFGGGDFRMRTEDRPWPPVLAAGDRLELGPLRATIARLLHHPRLIAIDFDGTPTEIWRGLASHGKPIQYSHIPVPLALWDTWTPIAGLPVAFEPPSAGFVLDWGTLASLSTRGIRFATITHAAGISSTGDAGLDALLPFDEPYRVPFTTAQVIREARKRNGRIIAIGTTVVRALEDVAADRGEVSAGERLATRRISRSSRLRVADAVLTGTHERGSSHYDLLRAFADDETLVRMDAELDACGYRTHEFGDSIFVERALPVPLFRGCTAHLLLKSPGRAAVNQVERAGLDLGRDAAYDS
jgi:S-adenosylmethionine:tRNA ribosyltransferase-isomerase